MGPRLEVWMILAVEGGRVELGRLHQGFQRQLGKRRTPLQPAMGCCRWSIAATVFAQPNQSAGTIAASSVRSRISAEVKTFRSFPITQWTS